MTYHFPEDYISIGRARVIEDCAKKADITHTQAASVFQELVNIGMIDYDIEKEVCYDIGFKIIMDTQYE